MKKCEIPYYKRSAVVARCLVFGLQTTVLLFQAKAVVLPEFSQPSNCQPGEEKLG